MDFHLVFLAESLHRLSPIAIAILSQHKTERKITSRNVITISFAGKHITQSSSIFHLPSASQHCLRRIIAPLSAISKDSRIKNLTKWHSITVLWHEPHTSTHSTWSNSFLLLCHLQVFAPEWMDDLHFSFLLEMALALLCLSFTRRALFCCFGCLLACEMCTTKRATNIIFYCHSICHFWSECHRAARRIYQHIWCEIESGWCDKLDAVFADKLRSRVLGIFLVALLVRFTRRESYAKNSLQMFRLCARSGRKNCTKVVFVSIFFSLVQEICLWKKVNKASAVKVNSSPSCLKFCNNDSALHMLEIYTAAFIFCSL